MKKPNRLVMLLLWLAALFSRAFRERCKKARILANAAAEKCKCDATNPSSATVTYTNKEGVVVTKPISKFEIAAQQPKPEMIAHAKELNKAFAGTVPIHILSPPPPIFKRGTLAWVNHQATFPN